jgi:hypothetical protein
MRPQCRGWCLSRSAVPEDWGRYDLSSVPRHMGLEGEQNVGVATTNGALRLLHASYTLIPQLLENTELILRAACEDTSN